MKANLRGSMLFALAPIVVLACGGFGAGPASADDVAPTPAVEKRRQVKGEVDIERSRVYAFVGKTGFGHEHGVVGRLKSGSIRLGAKENAGQLEFDLTSF